MTRREVLIQMGSLLLLVPAGTVFVGCGGSDDGDGDGGTGTALTFTSSVVMAHSHRVSIQMSELTDPPSGGVNRNTTVDDGHLHTVSLAEADLRARESGLEDSKETTRDNAHTHTFEFRKA
jgi:hypothetical protein